MDDSPLLVLDRVTVAFGGVLAVDDVSFKVGPTEVIGLIGPNGAGKTSLLNAVSSVITYGGSITFDGEPLARLAEWELSRRGISRTFQLAEHFREFTLVEYVMLGELAVSEPSVVRAALGSRGVFRRDNEVRSKASRLLAEQGLDRWVSVRLADSPYGIQKLADICRAILGEPRLVLLDEPTSGTSRPERTVIMRVLQGIKERGVAAIIVDHDPDFVASVADRIILLDAGSVLADGSPKAVLSSAEASRAYFGGRQSGGQPVTSGEGCP